MRNVLGTILLISALATSCSQPEESTLAEDSSTSPPLQGAISIESKGDGTGASVSSVTLEIGDSLQVYAVERDHEGNYIAPVEVSWVLNGSVGNLDIQSGGQEAQFTASTAGSGSIKASYDGQSHTISLNVNAASIANLSLTPASLSNIDITGGASPGSAVTLTLTNDGSANSATLQSPVIGGDDASQFQLVAGQDNCTGQVLAANSTCTFQIEPLASSNGAYSANVAIGDGSLTSNSSLLSGSASGFNVSLSLSPASSSGMDITGGTSPGAAVTFTLENTGTLASGALLAPQLSGANSANFQIVAGQDNCSGNSLAAGATCSFQMQPVASSDGAYTANLSVSDGSVTSSSSTLSGTASGFSAPSLSLTPASSSNMDIASGSSPSSAITLSLENTGGGASATLEAPSFSGSNPDNFFIVPGQDNCTGTSLSSGATCTFQVKAMASRNLSYTASISVSDGSVSSNSASLSGTASGFTTGDTLLFVSSATYTGNLGGLSGADAKCNTLASSAGLPNSFVALLSTSSVDAKDRVSIGGIVKMTNGTKIADTAADLWDGTLDSVLDKNENGNVVVQGRVWTGSNASGVKSADTCSGWSTAAGGTNGVSGQSVNDDTDWMNKATRSCDEENQIYCAGSEFGPLNLTGNAGPSNGDINVQLILPGSIPNYDSISFRRISGANAPSSNCDGSSDTVAHTETKTFVAGEVLSFTDATGTPGGSFSYRACVYDNSSNLLVSAIVEAVSATP